MHRGDIGKNGTGSRARILGLAVALLLLPCGRAWGVGLVGANYALNWDNKVDKTQEGTKTTNTFKHSLDVRYRGFLRPVVQNEITLKVEQTLNPDGTDVIRVNPTINLAYKGSYWNAGAKRTIEDTNEPGNLPKTTDAYFVEVYIQPARATLPDLKTKYNIDKDFQEAKTNTVRNALVVSTAYRPFDWLDVKGDYNLNRMDDRLNPDSDTTEDKTSGTVGVRHVISDKIRFEAEYRAEVTRGATLLDNGAKTNEKEDQAHTWKNSLAMRPFKDTGVDASYDYSLQQNMKSHVESMTKNSRVSVTQRLGIFDLKGEFTRALSQAVHTDDDNDKTEDTVTGDARFKFSKQLSFTAKAQRKGTREIHYGDPTKNTTSGSRNLSATWTGDLAPFWNASASYDKTDTITKDVATATDTRYNLKCTFDFKAINLLFDPSYDYALHEDFTGAAANSEAKTYTVHIGYKLFQTNNMLARADHTYTRKTDSGLQNIQRTDSSTANLTWTEPLPGWNLGFDFTRSGSDTSGDDLPPDVSATYNFKVDYKRDQMTFGANAKYDRKRVGDDSESLDLKAGWTAPKWDLTLSYSYTKTFSMALTEGYTVSIAFKYTL